MSIKHKVNWLKDEDLPFFKSWERFRRLNISLIKEIIYPAGFWQIARYLVASIRIQQIKGMILKTNFEWKMFLFDFSSSSSFSFFLFVYVIWSIYSFFIIHSHSSSALLYRTSFSRWLIHHSYVFQSRASSSRQSINDGVIRGHLEYSKKWICQG